MIPDVGLPDSVQALMVLIAFFMPGFIAGKVFDLCFPRPHIPERIRLLEYLMLSSANYAAWSWLVALVGRLWQTHPLTFALVSLLVLLVSPPLLGFGMADATENRSFQRVARHFGVRAPHPAGTAWEWFFREHQRSRWWVVARLRSGRIVYGFFGWNSYMGIPARRAWPDVGQVFNLPVHRPWGRGHAAG